MARYKATINIDRGDWDNFRARCAEIDTTASEEIRKFINLFICGEQQNQVTKQQDILDPQSAENLIKEIKADLIEEIEPKFKSLSDRLTVIENKTDNKVGSETDDETDNKVGSETDDETDTETDDETDNKVGSETDDETDTETDTETDDKIKQYSDYQVGQIEGKSRSTIYRYRKHGTLAKDESFYSRWRVDGSQKNWQRIKD